MISLFDYQEKAVMELRRSYASGCNSPLLVLPTGAGKTVCFTHMTEKASEKGLRILILVHRRELVNQVSEALDKWGVSHGRIAPDSRQTQHPVQIAMVQTLSRRVKMDRAGLYRFDFVILDEAHHAVQQSTWGDVLRHNEGARILGVTATPCRLDGKGLGKNSGGFFDDMIIGPTVNSLISMGRLVQPVVYAPDKTVDLSGIAKRGGDYAIKQLAGRMDDRTLTGDAVAHYNRLCGGAPAIAFTITREHAEHVTEDFKRGGYQWAVLSGETKDRDRARMIRDLGTGALHGISSCNVVSEGTDIPGVTAAILLRPTASLSLSIQQIGRALRTAPGKDRAIILDHAGNCHRHGLPTEEIEWSLEGAKKRKSANLRPCVECGALTSKIRGFCTICVPPRADAISQSKPDQEEMVFSKPGELVELTPAMRAAIRRKRLAEERLAASPDELAELGRSRGYKYPDAWAKHRYQELKGA